MSISEFIIRGLIGSCLLSATVTFADDDIRTRFLKEAPIAWDRQEKREEVGSGTIQLQRWVSLNGKREDRRQQYFKYYRKGLMIRLDISKTSENAVGSSFLTGKQYGAHLKRQKSEEPLQAKWLGTPEEMLESIPKSTYFFNAIRATRSLWARSLKEVIENPKFRILEIKSLVRDGRTLVELKFDCVTNDPQFCYYESSLILDPKIDWSIVEADYYTDKQRKWVDRIRNTFNIEKDGSYKRKSSDLYSHSFADSTEDHFEFSFIEYLPTAPSDVKFTLSDFGLPEPTKAMPADHGSTVYLWLIGFAIAFLVVAIGLRRASARLA